MARDTRTRRDRHALNGEGMVLCNPRDREAAHRAEVEGIATPDPGEVTCKNCLRLMGSGRGAGRGRRGRRDDEAAGSGGGQ